MRGAARRFAPRHEARGFRRGLLWTGDGVAGRGEPAEKFGQDRSARGAARDATDHSVVKLDDRVVKLDDSRANGRAPSKSFMTPSD
jgi:hypothetical protein